MEWLILNDTDPRHYQTTAYERRIHPTANIPPRGGKANVNDNVEIALNETGNPC